MSQDLDSPHLKAVRLCGAIEGASEALRMVGCMPCDRQTMDLIETARFAMKKAVISSMEYAVRLAPSEAKP